MKFSKNICVVLVNILTASFLISCAPQEGYSWGAYEIELYGYYNNPERLENLMKALEEAIAEGEKLEKSAPATAKGKSRRVPPGLYAEYGYLLTLNGDSRAKSYFEKEKEIWPESKVLMDKMIKVIDQNNARKSKLGKAVEGNSVR